MIIIIDAYNFIKSVSGQKFISEQEIQQWIETFKAYCKIRPNKIILVFDAGPDYFPSTHRFDGVTVMYAGHQKIADDVIKDWLERNIGADVLLVSSDRDICFAADRAQIASVGSYDFYKIFNQIMNQAQDYEHKVSGFEIYKLDQGEQDQNASLDELMEQASRCLIEGKVKKDERLEFVVRGGKKASRADKQVMKKIDKI